MQMTQIMFVTLYEHVLCKSFITEQMTFFFLWLISLWKLAVLEVMVISHFVIFKIFMFSFQRVLHELMQMFLFDSGS